jgi:hypothetical protein
MEENPVSGPEREGPLFRLPGLPHVFRSVPADPPWTAAPRIAAQDAERTDARLRDIGERIRRGNHSDLRALAPARFGRTIRGPGDVQPLSRD